MLYNNSYNINFKKLALLLLPTIFRKNILGELAKLLVTPIAGIHGGKYGFAKFRFDCNFRLTHNGQRCYLRGCLNELYDPLPKPEGHRIEIGEAEETTAFVIWERNNDKDMLVLVPADSYLMINARGYAGNGVDFTVLVPEELITGKSSKYANIYATIDEYKLASKQFIILPLNKE